MPLLSTESRRFCSPDLWTKTWLSMVQPRIARPWSFVAKTTHSPPAPRRRNLKPQWPGRVDTFLLFVYLCVCYGWEEAGHTIVNGDAKHVASVLGRGRYKSKFPQNQEAPLSRFTAATKAPTTPFPSLLNFDGKAPPSRGENSPTSQ